MTQPDVRRSRLQEYRLTPDGGAFVAALRGGNAP